VLDCAGLDIDVRDEVVFVDIDELGHQCLTCANVSVVNDVGIRVVEQDGTACNITESKKVAVTWKEGYRQE